MLGTLPRRIFLPFARPRGAGRAAQRLVAPPHVSDLLDVVDDGEELPLRIHLGSSPKREASHALVLKVAEDRFHRGDASVVDGAPRWAIKLPTHAFACIVFLLLARSRRPLAMLDHCQLSLLRAFGIAQTL